MNLPLHLDCLRIPKILWEGCVIFSNLFHISLFSKSNHLTLSHRNIKMGGVENAGNTCILSVLLQEIAALPSFYDPLLKTTLKLNNGESESHFQDRKNLQQQLNLCAKALRANQVINKKTICYLSKLLLRLDWQKETSTYWRRLLHQFAPNLFSLPMSDPHDLYDKLLSLFQEISSTSHRIVLLGKKSNENYRNVFEKSAFINLKENILWRLAQNPSATNSPEETFKINNRIFTLKLVQTCTNQHVVIYRKEMDRWICCDDVRAYPVKILPNSNIHLLVYSSRTK